MSSTMIGFLILAVGIFAGLQFRKSWKMANAPVLPPDEVRLARIRWVARCFKWICCALFGIVVFLAFIAIFMPEMVAAKADLASIQAASEPVMTVVAPIALRDFKPEMKWLYYLFWMLYLVYLIRFISFFYRLLVNLEHGILFSRDNVQCIRNIGWWVVITPILALFFEVSKLCWAIEGPGMIETSGVVDGLAKGIFIIFIAWIMDEGRKIQEEQELTV